MLQGKRIEIITSSTAEERVRAILEACGLTGYTFLSHVKGKGKRGVRSDDDFMDVFHNCYFLIACEEAKARQVVEAIRQLIAEQGGVCLMTDCTIVNNAKEERSEL